MRRSLDALSVNPCVGGNSMRPLSLSSKVILVLVAAAGLQGAVLARNYALRPEPVNVGDRIPPVDLEQAGVPLSLDLARLPDCSRVVFIIPTCRMCQILAPRWATEFRDPAHPLTLLVSLSDYEPAREYAARSALGHLPLYATGEQASVDASERMGVFTIPTIAVIRGGRVAALGVGREYTLDGLARQAQCPLKAPAR